MTEPGTAVAAGRLLPAACPPPAPHVHRPGLSLGHHSWGLSLGGGQWKGVLSSSCPRLNRLCGLRMGWGGCRPSNTGSAGGQQRWGTDGAEKELVPSGEDSKKAGWRLRPKKGPAGVKGPVERLRNGGKAGSEGKWG